MSLIGEKFTVTIEKTKTISGENLWIKSITQSLPIDTIPVRLACGKIKITDYSNTSSVRLFASKQLDKLHQSTGSYLLAWDKYSSLEGDMLLQKGRDIGTMEYGSVERTLTGWRFYLKEECPSSLSSGDMLDIVSETPEYLCNTMMTWEDFFRHQEDQYATTKKEQQSSRSNVRSVFRGTVQSLSSKSVELECEQAGRPASEGMLVYSILGDMVQMERRFKARNDIRQGRSANPLLGLLIEEEGVLPPSKGHREHVQALTAFVRDKIFRHPPTVMQEKAVEIALNTPDIALIQGPPGTGKTTVIAAIVERLNQLLDPATVRGSILVSGFQHDAVDNLIARLSVNSLPTIKFGSKRGEGNIVSEAGVANWCKNLASRLRSRYPELAPCEQIQTLRTRFLAYHGAANTENEKLFFEAARSLPSNLLSDDAMSMIEEGIDRLQREEMLQKGGKREALLRYVYALRTSSASFADDGPRMAAEALIGLEDFLDEGDRQLLLSLPSSPEGENEYFKAIQSLKEKLFDILLPEPQYTSLRPRQQVVDLMEMLEREIQKLGDGSGRLQVVADFLNGLENSPEGAWTAIGDCNVVYAATVQQSEGRDITQAKKRMRDNTKGRAVIYDTVIVDEAARTSPMDLLIPMAQASKRIILVGDHKQLPHIIDEEIARRLEAGEDASLLKESMFEYLFRRLQKLTAQDGIQRTVTLDAQFRMHPLLGDFVSRSFYKGAVRSPLGPQYFTQSLDGLNGRPAMWIDVPCALGAEELAGTSRKRAPEAKAIVRQLMQWMASESGRNLSFGVISFYKAQANYIQDLALQSGLLDRKDNTLCVAPGYEGVGVSERLRINTVDAFQGMEFDVVFLSMVRSRPVDSKSLHGVPERQQRRVFGHLVSKNRLCVALSRQKKVLVLVGDSAMVTSELGREAVPELTDFLHLCKTEGVVSRVNMEEA